MSGKKRKKTGEKFLNEIDPLNGPYTQCKNGHQREFKYSFFTLKRAWLTNCSQEKNSKECFIYKEVSQGDLNIN